VSHHVPRMAPGVCSFESGAVPFLHEPSSARHRLVQTSRARPRAFEARPSRVQPRSSLLTVPGLTRLRTVLRSRPLRTDRPQPLGRRQTDAGAHEPLGKPAAPVSHDRQQAPSSGMIGHRVTST
jgi:hypothetical protein